MSQSEFGMVTNASAKSGIEAVLLDMYFRRVLDLNAPIIQLPWMSCQKSLLREKLVSTEVFNQKETLRCFLT